MNIDNNDNDNDNNDNNHRTESVITTTTNPTTPTITNNNKVTTPTTTNSSPIFHQQQQPSGLQPPSLPLLLPTTPTRQLQQHQPVVQPSQPQAPQYYHAPDSTVPMMDPALLSIQNIKEKLLNLRGCGPSLPGNNGGAGSSNTTATTTNNNYHNVLSFDEIQLICQMVKPILLENPSSLLEIDAPIIVCGDIHGQYIDLLRLFEYGGFPPEQSYLFLGDYVDRGKQSIEVICLLLCYKILFDTSFFLLRGNHECAGINRIYGFYDECKRRYHIKCWKCFCDVFNCLPVAALIDDKILCMHGGLSPELYDLQQIVHIERPCDVPDVGLLCDLLWSDPNPNELGWNDNDRGVSFVFGTDVVTEFVLEHDLDLIIRAHQVVEDGYEFFAGRKCITLFSAPNYCNEFDNAGGMIYIDENLLCTIQILKPTSALSSTTYRNHSHNNNNNNTISSSSSSSNSSPTKTTRASTPKKNCATSIRRRNKTLMDDDHDDNNEVDNLPNTNQLHEFLRANLVCGIKSIYNTGDDDENENDTNNTTTNKDPTRGNNIITTTNAHLNINNNVMDPNQDNIHSKIRTPHHHYRQSSISSNNNNNTNHSSSNHTKKKDEKRNR